MLRDDLRFFQGLSVRVLRASKPRKAGRFPASALQGFETGVDVGADKARHQQNACSQTCCDERTVPAMLKLLKLLKLSKARHGFFGNSLGAVGDFATRRLVTSETGVDKRSATVLPKRLVDKWRLQRNGTPDPAQPPRLPHREATCSLGRLSVACQQLVSRLPVKRSP